MSDEYLGFGNKSDFEGMVSLAEASSKKLSELNRKIMSLNFKLGAISLIAVMLGYLSFFALRYYDGLAAISSAYVVGGVIVISMFLFVFAYLICFCVYYLGRTKKERNVELVILHELLDIIFESLKFLSHDLSPLERSIIEIRLKRVRFSEGI